jgi:hypothetical protein
MKRYKKVRSGFEAKIVSMLKATNKVFEYESMKIKYMPPPAKMKTYTPDIILPNGIIIELKGYFKSTDRSKHLRVRDQNPDLDIRFVFQRSKNTLGGKSSTTYGEWCDSHGFLWSEGIIPESWFSEAHVNVRLDKK